MNKDDVVGLVEWLNKYIADYTEAPSWGGPTMYPTPPSFEQIKTMADALTTLSARVETLEAQGDSPFGALRSLIQSDPDYAWGWLCNLAVPIMDATGVSHELANQAAALIMSQMFNHDITAHPNFEYAKTGQQEYFEARIAAERNDGGDDHG